MEAELHSAAAPDYLAPPPDYAELAKTATDPHLQQWAWENMTQGQRNEALYEKYLWNPTRDSIAGALQNVLYPVQIQSMLHPLQAPAAANPGLSHVLDVLGPSDITGALQLYGGIRGGPVGAYVGGVAGDLMRGEPYGEALWDPLPGSLLWSFGRQFKDPMLGWAEQKLGNAPAKAVLANVARRLMRVFSDEHLASKREAWPWQPHDILNLLMNPETPNPALAELVPVTHLIEALEHHRLHPTPQPVPMGSGPTPRPTLVPGPEATPGMGGY